MPCNFHSKSMHFTAVKTSCARTSRTHTLYPIFEIVRRKGVSIDDTTRCTRRSVCAPLNWIFIECKHFSTVSKNRIVDYEWLVLSACRISGIELQPNCTHKNNAHRSEMKSNESKQTKPARERDGDGKREKKREHSKENRLDAFWRMMMMSD